MQPLQMRFMVTKESIANVYSVIKSAGPFHIIPATGMAQAGIILLKHQTELCQKLFEMFEYSRCGLIAGAGMR